MWEFDTEPIENLMRINKSYSLVAGSVVLVCLIDCAMSSDGVAIFEFIVLAAANVVLYFYLTRDGSSWQRIKSRLQSTRSPASTVNVLDALIAVGLLVAFFAALWFKLNITEPRRGSSHAKFQYLWLLQPCYVTQVMLLFVVLFPKSKYNSTVFTVLCSWVWGALASFLFPDRAGYTQFLELENYFLQHYLLLLTPLFYIMIRRADAYAHLSWRDSWIMSMYGGCLHNLYHVFVLWVVAVLSDINLNYMLSPPAKVPRFVRESPHYRSMIMVAGLLLFTPVFGLLVPKLLMKLPPLPFISHKVHTQ